MAISLVTDSLYVPTPQFPCFILSFVIIGEEWEMALPSIPALSAPADASLEAAQGERGSRP